jgi:hypothetical protein
MIRKKEHICNSRNAYLYQQFRRRLAITLSTITFFLALFAFGISTFELKNLVVNMVSELDAHQAWFWSGMSVLAFIASWLMLGHTLQLLNTRVLMQGHTEKEIDWK